MVVTVMNDTTHANKNREELRAIADEAYIFGYPLVIADLTRQVMTHTSRANEHKAPVGQFAHHSSFPDASYTDVVSPNADTLYSLAFLDVSKEPAILSVPNMGERFYLMSLYDFWTDVFTSIGTRTTGNGAGTF